MSDRGRAFHDRFRIFSRAKPGVVSMHMRRLAFSAATLFALFLAACGTDNISPNNGQAPSGAVPGPALTAPVCDNAATITSDLTTLMAKLTPNDQSALTKWNTVQSLMASGQTSEAQAYAQDPLLTFINKKFQQAGLTGADLAYYTNLLNKVTAGITCFVTPYDIPTTNNVVVKVLPNNLGGVYFPPGFCDASCGGINVTLEQVPQCTATGSVGCLNTLLDQYGDYLKITLTGGTPNPAISAIVALCVPGDVDPTLARTLLVGHQDDLTSSSNGFTVLNPAAIPDTLFKLLTCPLPLAQAGPPPTMLGRLASRLADLLLPEKASARMYYFAGFGIGGTTKTFSPFGLVSPTLSATGGTGGTKTTFSPSLPGLSPAGPSLTTISNNTITDTAGHKEVAGVGAVLPGVYVKTNLGTGIPNATVTFSVSPTLLEENQPGSSAEVCNASGNPGSIDVPTDGNGYAELPCLNFGTKAGYKQLSAVIDISTASGISAAGLANVTVTACEPTGCGTASATTQLNWLIKTLPGNAAQLVMVTQPSPTAQSGIGLGTQPTVKLQDLSGNDTPVSGINVKAELAVPGTATLATTLTVTTDGTGLAKFTDLVISGPIGTYNLKFTSGSLTSATSSDISLGAGAPNKLVVTAISTSVAAGELFTTPPVVEVQDAAGNKTGSTALIGVTVGSGATLAGVQSKNATAGSATFTDLTVGGLGSPAPSRTLTFASAGLAPAMVNVEVTVGPAKKLAVTSTSTSVAAGELFTTPPVVEVQDQFGNKTGSTALIGVTVGSGATLAGVQSKNATAGSATFTDLTIGGLGSPALSRTLTFTSTGLDQAAADLNVTAGPAKKLAVTAISTSVAAGELFATPPVVEVQDQFGNKTGSTALIGVTVGSGATLAGVQSKNATAGSATFTDLTIGGLGSPALSRTLAFTSTGLDQATADLNVTAGPAKLLTIENLAAFNATTAAAGNPFGTQPQVQVRDQFGNATPASLTVTATVTTKPLNAVGGILNPPAMEATNASGLATFNALGIGGTQGGWTLSFGSGSLTAATSGTITVTAGAAAQITTNNPASGTYPGTPAPFTSATAPAPQVKVLDAWNNPAGATVSWLLTGSGTSTGASLSSNSTTSDPVTGLSSVTWGFGDGGNSLTASLSATTFATFTATTSTGASLAACTLSGTTKKTDLAKFSSGLTLSGSTVTGGYLGYFSIPTSAGGMIRSVQVQMSVTGQSSGDGNYPTELRAYKMVNGFKVGNAIATFKPTTTVLKLPGSNSTPTAITYTLTSGGSLIGIPSETIIFELQIQAASTRTFQVWYNTKPSGAACVNSKLYTPGTVTGASNFSAATFLAGHALKVTN